VKKAGRSFGDAEKDYRLGHIFYRSVSEFNQADAEMQKLEKDYKRDKEVPMIQKMFAVGERRTEAGVVAIMAAVAWIEQNLYAYTVRFLDADSYEMHLDNLRLLTRYLLLPRLCQGKAIDEQNPAIHDLRELIAARNAVIHPKKHIMYDDPLRAHKRLEKESARFLTACRKLESTVAALKKLLSSD
jgi:hypothetical protein